MIKIKELTISSINLEGAINNIDFSKNNIGTDIYLELIK